MLRLAMVIGVWVLISGGTYGWAEASCDADIVRTWQMDRDSAVIRLLKGWLNGQPMEALHPHILTLTRSEVFLHTCCPGGGTTRRLPVAPAPGDSRSGAERRVHALPQTTRH